MEHLSLGSTPVGIILLCGLFVYDIFWVFCTPVMVGCFCSGYRKGDVNAGKCYLTVKSAQSALRAHTLADVLCTPM